LSDTASTNLQKIVASDLPIVVDLDRTLAVRDIFHTLAVTHFLRKPLQLPRFIWTFFSSGKVGLKKAVAESVEFDLETHPLNEELIAFLKSEKAKGKKIVLCSGAYQQHVEIVAEHVGVFDSFYGSADSNNLVGRSKADFLVSLFGKGNFDYIGDSKADLIVGEVASNTAIIKSYKGLSEARSSRLESAKLILKQLRVKHWLKNLLIFVPILTAHQELKFEDVARALIFFLAFSILASGTYILNDLHDLRADSLHAEKRNRPIVAGRLKITTSLVLAFLLLTLGLGLAASQGSISIALMLAYLVLTTLYSAILKRVLILDIVCLSALYTLRILAGTFLLQLQPTFWLLAFSLFIFFSLAAVKRFTELVSSEKEKIPGRGYLNSDAEIVGQLGSMAGFSAIIVFALYINSAEVMPFYRHPQFLWFGLVILLYWVSYLWVKTRRRDIHSDPIDWAVTDVRSAAAFCSLVLVALLATYF
jgi:4-hydroxybenzoate polyprenyltransferase